MPQNANAAVVAQNPSKAGVPLQVNGAGALLVTTAGAKSALNQTATGVIKTGPGVAGKLIIVSPGTTSGALTLNDSATVGGAAASNTIFSMAFGSLAAGQTYDLNFPFTNGLVISAVPGGGTPIYSISYE